jgi:hypothetical protein
MRRFRRAWAFGNRSLIAEIQGNERAAAATTGDASINEQRRGIGS